MKSPITLYVPSYYNAPKAEKNRWVFQKTEALLKEDSNHAQCIASIEIIENYQCETPEISETYRGRASQSFHSDRKENRELNTQIGNCKVYTYNWDDKNHHFRIYWIVISEEHMLQLVGIFEPKHSAYYKQHFMMNGLDTEIDTTFNFSSEIHPDQLFEWKPVKTDTEELQARIDSEKQKEDRAEFLEENLRTTNPKFYSLLQEELKEKGEATIESFMCRDWNLHYDLHNPENFSNPDSDIEWEDNSGIYDYFEKPYTDNSKINIIGGGTDQELEKLKMLVGKKGVAEEKLLSFFERYTFGNGGAYADAIHYRYAKTEIERLQNTPYTNQEFLKRNLCLIDIVLSEHTDTIDFYFNCSWDTEHGIQVRMSGNEACKVV